MSTFFTSVSHHLSFLFVGHQFQLAIHSAGGTTLYVEGMTDGMGGILFITPPCPNREGCEVKIIVQVDRGPLSDGGLRYTVSSCAYCWEYSCVRACAYMPAYSCIVHCTCAHEYVVIFLCTNPESCAVEICERQRESSIQVLGLRYAVSSCLE